MQEHRNQPYTVNCPHCKKPVEWVEANQFRPFCSERCQLIDLGAWASEEYRIEDPAPVIPDEFEDDQGQY